MFGFIKSYEKDWTALLFSFQYPWCLCFQQVVMPTWQYRSFRSTLQNNPYDPNRLGKCCGHGLKMLGKDCGKGLKKKMGYEPQSDSLVSLSDNSGPTIHPNLCLKRDKELWRLNNNIYYLHEHKRLIVRKSSI